MRYFAYIIALLGGIALSFQGATYGELGKTIGRQETSFYNFSVGAIILGLLWLVFGKGKISDAVHVPKWSVLLFN